MSAKAVHATLHIGEVAERVGLSLRTVRYYEEQGLLTPEARSAGGFRLYTELQVDRLALIKQMKPLGFTVQEMRELLDARDALREPGGSDAVNLKVAEQYVDAFAKLAKTNNSIIVPANLSDISGLIAGAMQVVRSQQKM